jgi:hypothetical protein
MTFKRGRDAMPADIAVRDSGDSAEAEISRKKI